MEAKNIRKAGTGKSAIGILAIAVCLIVIGVAVYYALSQPGVMDSVMSALAIVGTIILAVIVIIYVFMAIIALPLYVHKGETYQVGMDYSLDDVQNVGEKTDKEEKPRN